MQNGSLSDENLDRAKTKIYRGPRHAATDDVRSAHHITRPTYNAHLWSGIGIAVSGLVSFSYMFVSDYATSVAILAKITNPRVMLSKPVYIWRSDGCTAK